MRRFSFRLIALTIALAFVAVSVQAKKHRSTNQAAKFDYYMLVLSYAPDFCVQKNVDKDPRECGSGRHVGYVVHGLWPQDETSRGPEKCGSASPVSQSIVQTMLNYFPTESLIQHEWRDHGTCTGLSSSDYFALVRKARDSVKIPDALTPSSQQSISSDQIQSAVASANPSFPKEAFRTSCYPNRELKELRVCMNKDLSPRACGSSAGQCSIDSVTLLPLH